MSVMDTNGKGFVNNVDLLRIASLKEQVYGVKLMHSADGKKEETKDGEQLASLPGLKVQITKRFQK